MAQDNARGFNKPIPLSGDASGNLDRSTVTKLYGNSVYNSAPSNNQRLSWSTANNRWEPKTVATSIVNYVPVVTMTANSDYTLLPNDVCVVYNVSGFNKNIYFPQSSPVGRIVMIGNNQSGYYSPTIIPHSGTSIQGSTTITYGIILICYDGTNWMTSL